GSAASWSGRGPPPGCLSWPCGGDEGGRAAGRTARDVGSLILAVRFLTIVPIPGREATGPGALGRAAWWFPVVGLALGAVLAAVDRGLAPLVPPMLSAVLLPRGWKGLTRGLPPRRAPRWPPGPRRTDPPGRRRHLRG